MFLLATIGQGVYSMVIACMLGSEREGLDVCYIELNHEKVSFVGAQ